MKKDIDEKEKSKNQEIELLHHKFDDALSKVFLKRCPQITQIQNEIENKIKENLNDEAYNTYVRERTNQLWMDPDNELRYIWEILSQLIWLRFLWQWDINWALEYMNTWDWWDFEPITYDIAETFYPFSDSFIKTFYTEWLRAIKSVDVEFQDILAKTFTEMVKKDISKEMDKYKTLKINDLNLNHELVNDYLTWLTDEEYEEFLSANTDWNIIQAYINLFYTKYPLAQNSIQYRVKSKKFLEQFTINQTETYIKESSSISDEILEKTEEHLKELNKNTLTTLAASYTWNIIMNYPEMIKYFTNKIKWYFLADYILAIENEFIKSNTKKSNELLEKINKQHSKSSQESYIKDTEEWNDKEKQTKNIESTTLSPEQEEYLTIITNKLTKDKKKWKSIYKHLKKVITKEHELSLEAFKKIFNIKEIPDDIEDIIFSKLNIQKKWNEENHTINEWRDISENCENDNEPQINNEIFKNDDEWDKNIESDNISNPTDYFINRINKQNLIITNESNLRKQISEFCKNKNYRTTLLSQLQTQDFDLMRDLKHKRWHKNARTLEIWVTWRRLLINVDDEWNFLVDSFCDHDDYLQRLILIK